MPITIDSLKAKIAEAEQQQASALAQAAGAQSAANQFAGQAWAYRQILQQLEAAQAAATLPTNEPTQPPTT